VQFWWLNAASTTAQLWWFNAFVIRAILFSIPMLYNRLLRLLHLCFQVPMQQQVFMIIAVSCGVPRGWHLVGGAKF
jgi:hypothetical protein